MRPYPPPLRPPQSVPTRLRIRISKKRSEEEDEGEQYVAFATVAEQQEFRGLGVTVVEDSE